MPNIYVAGPLFDPGERWYLEQVDALCQEAGFDTYLPHRDTGLVATPEGIFVADRDALMRANLVVAVLNGPDVDSGTAWEIGVAYARGVPVIGIQEDLRLRNTGAQNNIMVHHACRTVCDSLDALRDALQQAARAA